MPIRIYPQSDIAKEIAFICKENWELPFQLVELVSWVARNKERLGRENTVADIGFSVRKSATGGGATLSADEMKVLFESRIDIYFSEYGNVFKDKK